MNLSRSIKRIFFTSSPLMLGILPAAGFLATAQAGCSSQVIMDIDGGGGRPPIISTGDFPIEPCDDICQVSTPGFLSSAACEKCHTTSYDEWKGSMHAHSLTSPVMIAQTNQVFAADLIKRDSPDPQWFCVNCHSPTSTLFGQDGRLPFTTRDPERVTNEALQEGVGCVTCHSYGGKPSDSAAALSAFQDDFVPGRAYFGPIKDPATSPFHQATVIPLFETDQTAETLCLSCHNVKNDRNADSVFELGTDLFLQTTFDEYKVDYRGNGGASTCINCHMAAKASPEQAAPGYPGSPFRTVHDHRFAGVDFPLDEVVDGNDPQKDARRALLQDNLGDTPDSAAALLEVQNIVFDGINLSFQAAITNKNSGHSLPTGFAFLRQMFLEVVVRDIDGNRLGQSGELQDPANDLCDKDTLTEALGALVQGCANNQPDAQLVNFQTQLVDFVTLQGGVLVKDPIKGHETVLQFQTGGAVARVRPIDKQSLQPLKPFETRTFGYTFVLPQQDQAIKIAVALKFRNLPPYFLRKLAQAEVPTTVGGLKGLLSTSKVFQFITMTSQFITKAPQ